MSRPDPALGPAAQRRRRRHDTSGELAANSGYVAARRQRSSGRLSRGKRIALVALGVVLFLAISAVLARYFSTENVERDHEWALMQAEARGDVQSMLAQLSGCRTRPSCVATVRADAASLQRLGLVEILSIQSPDNHSLTSSVGEARVAWKVAGRYPVVQCVRVRRSGNILTGISIALLSVGPRIGSTADCPG